MNRIKIKLMLLVWLLISLLVFSACTPRIVKKQMVEYYSDDSNYISFTGSIIDILPYKDEWIIRVYQNEIDDFITDTTSQYENRFVSFLLTGECYNKIVESGLSLQIGEQYIFTSATDYWYSGFDYPIVEIKDVETNDVYLDFEFGKASYIYWIQNVMT